MSLPKTTTTRGGSLGKVEATEDGTSLLVLSGIAVGGQFALGDVLGPFLRLQDAEDKGITEQYDTDNSTVAWKHIKDFYTEAEILGVRGVKLYVMVVAMTQTLTLTATAATANGYKKAIDATDGAPKLVGLTFTPGVGYTPTYEDQQEADLWTALAQIKITQEGHRGTKDFYRVIVEGRNFQGTFASIKNMRASATTPGVNAAMVVNGNDYEYGLGAGYKSKYASVGAVLGRAAAVKVNRNIGRVKDGRLASITTPGFSDGSFIRRNNVQTIDGTKLDLANDYGYVFFRMHKRKAGAYISDDHMACVSTDIFSQLTLGRTMDKIDSIIHSTNIEEILDEIEVDPSTGQLDSTTAVHYGALVDDAINAQMGGTAKEISGVKTYVDPAQKIIQTSALVEDTKVVPTGTLREIRTNIKYATSL